jgi:hypothetical protein
LRDLSLHILDILENSIRAGATHVGVVIAEDPERDAMELVVEDNGPGLPVSAEEAVDPFFTTKAGKRTGLGLPLLKASAECAGGRLELGEAREGGLAVRAMLGLSHIDRLPLGDIAATLAGIACTNPDLDLCCTLRVADRAMEVRTSQVAAGMPGRGALAVARSFGERIRAGIKELGVVA